MKTDTIAAIATGLSNSGIGIIRVSGDEAINIVNKIYKNKNNEHSLYKYKSHTIHYGFIYDNDNVIDEVMVSVFIAPYSFTTEDTVEINCHGGIYVLKKILELVLKNGARIAEPGEFTKRAFLHGRIDLTKAEAVMDMIHAENDFALKSSMRQLSGELSEKIKKLRDKIIYEIAFIESALDDPEHISLDNYPEELDKKVKEIKNELSLLLKNADNGSILKNGINTVIIGKPNAGKSSLLNRLAGKERAIVTDIAGTTRDIIEEKVIFGDVTLNIIDTAGIRDTSDTIEKIGVEKAISYAKDADLVIYVVDSSILLDDNDYEIMDLLKDKKSIILFNKSDLNSIVDENEIKKKLYSDIPIIKTSTKAGTGFDELEHIINDMFLSGLIEQKDEIYLTNMRHKDAINEAYNSINMVIKSIEDLMPEDFFSIDLMNAYKELGYIIGEEVEDDLVNEIFTKFCMGK